MPITITAAAEQIRNGKLAPMDLVDTCLEQIDRYESTIRAWVFVDEKSARVQAEKLGEELKRGHYRGPLHGIPIGVKDIFDVFDWPTAAGSKLWENSIARADAAVIKKLRQAGAIFLGKTVTTQYASFDPPVTKNPWNHQRTPGGSSSGSAAALACGMCLGATSSQTGGSITRPASYCGVAGLKPTHGVVPLDGIVPLAPSMDHPGPMANCVRDLALLFQAMADGKAFERFDDSYLPDFVANIGWTEPPRIGVLHGMFDDMSEEPMKQMMKDVTSRLNDRGANILDVGLPAEFLEVIPRHRTVMAVECADYHKERLEKHPDDYLPNIRALIEEGLNCPAPEYYRCREHQYKLCDIMSSGWDDVDALLAPATTGPAPDTSTTGSPAFNSPWSYTGLPVVSVPAGWTDDGLPLAIQLIGGEWDEANLLGVAAWCEKALGFESRDPEI